MAIITTGSIPKALWPGLQETWGLTYELWDKGAQWRQLFRVYKSNKQYEEDISITPFGLAPRKDEGDSIHFDTMKQTYVSRYDNITYALGFIISQEAVEDNLYASISQGKTQALAQSIYRTREITGASILNNAFNTSPQHLGGDGQPLVSSTHPIDGTSIDSISNELSGAGADLSIATLEQAKIDIANFRDNRGNLIHILPRKLVVPPQLEFVATRLLKNAQWAPGTANRDINAIYVNNTFPEGYSVNNYLVNPSAWFILTDCPTPLKHFDRVPVEFAQDNDFNTTDYKYRVRGRWSFGWSDWRAVFGSNG